MRSLPLDQLLRTLLLTCLCLLAACGGGSSDDEDDVSADGLNCLSGQAVRCENGDRLCAELLCNGVPDCEDGSDETDKLCVTSRDCCIESNGCPSESSNYCGEGCCCCPLRGLVCNRAAPAVGCVASRTAGEAIDPTDPLLKLLQIPTN